MINQAQPPLEFIPPALNPLFLRFAQAVLPTWMRASTPITHIEADNVEVLVDLYRQFQEKKIRLMLAFRHPRVEDPLCLGYLLSQIVPKVARRQQVSLEYPTHSHFIYDRGIPLWAGAHIGWVLSNLGGTPIQRGKADWTGLRSARDLFANGSFPMAAAPEGATNGLTEVVSPLEPGIAQLGFWCAEDVQKAGRSEQVLILPIGLKYSYVEAPWSAIANLLSELEAACGLTSSEFKVSSEEFNSSSLYPRLIRLSNRLLDLMQSFYGKFYRHKFPELETFEGEDDNSLLVARLQALLNAALVVSEEYFDLQPKGNLSDRCRRVEQAGWNCIFREDFKDIKALSPLERALGDRIAEEANSRMWHMRLVESFAAVTGKYVREKPTPERFAETTLIVWEMMTKILGGNAANRPILGRQSVKIAIGQPLSVSDRYPVYKANRLGARQAVADLTKDLQVALEELIHL